MLSGKNFSIKEQFPEEIEKRRQKLYGVMKRAKHEGRHVSLVHDKLYIEGEVIRTTRQTSGADGNRILSKSSTEPTTNTIYENVRQANKRQRIGSSPNPNIA
jgi:hypothetical protein